MKRPRCLSRRAGAGLRVWKGCAADLVSSGSEPSRDLRNRLTDGRSCAQPMPTAHTSSRLSGHQFKFNRPIGELLEPTKKFLSSTTPGSAAIDRFTRAREKTELFVGFSYEHLRADVARGSGEHLASLAVLAGIPAERRPQFQEYLRDAYSAIFHESLASRDTRLRIVNAAWAEGFGRLESDTIKHQETGISNIDLKLGKSRNSPALMSLR